MRVTLIHNPTAGDESHSAERLREILREEGYEVDYRSADGPWKKALEHATDLVVAAGGDGTIGNVAKRLAHRGIAMAVLPIGTANNIGKTLGVTGEAREAIASWRTVRPRPFDLGMARAPWGEERFVESIGGGVFAALIASGDDVNEPSMILGRETDRALHVLQGLLESAEPVRWGIEVDGHDLSGDYLGVEVLNTRFAGPNVPLARNADPGDGLLDLVAIGESDRSALLEYVRQRIATAAGELAPLPTYQGRRMRLVAPAGVPLHLDDEPWPAESKAGRKATIDASVDPGALHMIA